MSHTLIATLGRAPGAVTGLYNSLTHLDEKPFEISELCLIMTSDRDVQLAGEMVEASLRQRLGRDCPKIVRQEFPEPDLRGSKRQIQGFRKMVIGVLDDYVHRENPPHIILGIAGGRSSMGAMLAMGAQLYAERVSGMYHMWVTPDLEADGDVLNLRTLELKDPSRYDEVLFPPPLKSQAVGLPYYDHSEFRKRVENLTTVEAAQQVSQSELKDLELVLSLLPDRLTVAQAQRYLQVMDDIQAGQDPKSHYGKLIEIMVEAGVPNFKSYLLRLDKMANQKVGDGEAVLNWIELVQQDNRSFGGKLRNAYAWYKTTIRPELAANLPLFSFVVSIIDIALKIAG